MKFVDRQSQVKFVDGQVKIVNGQVKFVDGLVECVAWQVKIHMTWVISNTFFEVS